MRPLAAFLALALLAPLAHAGPGADQRRRVAERWAPTIYQETRDKRDLLAAFDFDGDWDLSNNAAHVNSAPLAAVVYVSVLETATHWFLNYLPYHPVDSKSPSGHDHDTEHITMVVRKDGSDTGRLEVVETRFHKVNYQYAGKGIGDAADDVDGPIHLGPDGHPEVYAQRAGHGICGGFAPLAWWNALELECWHKDSPHIEKRGVVYRFRGRAEVPRSIDDRNVGYQLLEMRDSLWAHARDCGPHAVFSSLMDFRGARCGRGLVCPRGIGAQLSAAPGHASTGAPWE